MWLHVMRSLSLIASLQMAWGFLQLLCGLAGGLGGKKKGWKEETTEPLEAQLDCEVSGTAPVRNRTILVDKCCTGRAINVEIFIAGFVADKLHHSSLPQYTHGHGHQKGGCALKQHLCCFFIVLCLPNNIELFWVNTWSLLHDLAYFFLTVCASYSATLLWHFRSSVKCGRC